MANSRDFLGSNHTLHPPAGLEEYVAPLPVHVGRASIISCWQLTEEEKKAVVETGVIYLMVAGMRHPPVYLSSLPMLEKFDEHGLLTKYDPDGSHNTPTRKAMADTDEV